MRFAAAAIVAGAGVVAASAQVSSPQTFRTTTDVVMVDVSVRSGGKPVADLTAADFAVTDNGVRQTVEAVETTPIPLDVTLLVDLSGNQHRPWIDHRLDRARIDHEVAAEVGAVATQLRPTDRIRLLVADTYVQQVWPLTSVGLLPAVRNLDADGMGSVYDSLAATLLQPVEPRRRHVVIARTKGVDTISAISATALGEIAERSDALMHLVIMEAAFDSDEELRQWQCSGRDGLFIGICWPTTRFWIPNRKQLVTRQGGDAPYHPPTPDGLLIQAGVRASGGDWHQTTGLSEPSLVGTFRKTFEEFRQSYVIRYTPSGVIRGGWHTIGVTVPKVRGASITARKGYGVEEAPKPATPAPIPNLPRTLEELTTAYERRAFQNVANGLRQVADPAKLMKDFEDAGNPWPAVPHREAAFAIEIAEAGLFSARAQTRDQADAMLARFSRLIRNPLEPEAFERQWFYAVLTLLQGTIRPGMVESFAARALDRFPNDPRFLLARAIAADQRAAAGGVLKLGSTNPTMAANAEATRVAFEAVLGLPEVATEARIRLGFLLYRQGGYDAALASLNEAARSPIQEPVLAYLHQLFLGHTFAAMDRIDDAVTAYRAALTLLPTAQSARVALMTTLYKRGDRTEAEALAEKIQTQSAEFIDPWWMYWQGQYRLHAQVMARVREMAR